MRMSGLVGTKLETVFFILSFAGGLILWLLPLCLQTRSARYSSLTLTKMNFFFFFLTSFFNIFQDGPKCEIWLLLKIGLVEKSIIFVNIWIGFWFVSLFYRFHLVKDLLMSSLFVYISECCSVWTVIMCLDSHPSILDLAHMIHYNWYPYVFRNYFASWSAIITEENWKHLLYTI